MEKEGSKEGMKDARGFVFLFLCLVERGRVGEGDGMVGGGFKFRL